MRNHRSGRVLARLGKSGAPRSRAHAKDLFGSGDDALFSLIDSAALEHLIGLDPHQLAPVERTRIERVLDLAVWTDMYKPTIVF